MENTIALFITSPIFGLIVLALFVCVALAACVLYYRPTFGRTRVRWYWILAAGVVLFRMLLAAVKTWLQYRAWLETDMSKYLLPPYQSITYLLRYGWTHFMLNAVITVGVALLFLIILRLLERHNGRFFDEGEVELGALLALVVGWPGFLLFVPLAFLSVVVLSLVRAVFWKETYTTLGLSFFIATAIALAFSSPLISVFKLGAFSI